MRRRNRIVFPACVSAGTVLSPDIQPLESRICLAVVPSTTTVVPPGPITRPFAFAPPIFSPIGNAAVIATGDFNNDHIPDVLAKNGADGSVKLFKGDGKGSFSPTGLPVSAGAGVTAIAVGDFNADGNLDAAFANGGPATTGGTTPGQTVTVALGNGNGGFSTQSYFAGGAPTAIAVGDFNGDKALDLAVADNQQWSPPGTLQPATYGAAVLLNNGDGTFGGARKIFLQHPQTQVAAGDINGDGSTDLAFGGDNVIEVGPVPLATLTAALNDGSANFTTKLITNIVGRCDGLALIDMNRDGSADLAALEGFARTYSPTATIYWTPGDATVLTELSKGDGTFVPVGKAPVPITRAAGLSVADFDHDGRPDFAVAGRDMRPTLLLPVIQGGVAVVRGLGGGMLGAPQVFITGGAVPLSQTVDDLNRDGRPDILTGNGAGVVALINVPVPVPTTSDSIDPTDLDL